jgi:PAS domain S-box-containing protein
MPMPTRHSDRGASELEELLVKGAAAVIATDLDGVITHWSAAAERLYGWSGDEAIGQPANELLVAACDRQRAAENLETVRQHGGWEGEFGIRSKSGDIVPSFVRTTVIKDDAGRPVGLLGVSMDVSAL